MKNLYDDACKISEEENKLLLELGRDFEGWLAGWVGFLEEALR